MKIALISGSHRNDSASEKTAKFIAKYLKSLQIESEIISLANNPLPLWGEDVFGNENFKATWAPISKTLNESDGAVVISPEWAGMAAPALKNFFLFVGTELANKPGLLVGVSAGVSGSYPIAELRMSSYKNSHLCYIPDHVIVRSAAEVLNGDTAQSERDQSIRDRLNYSTDLLVEYAKAFKLVRASGKVDLKKYPFGM